MDYQLVLAGLLVGLVIGLTSIGGGSLLAPILILVGVPPTQAVGTGLLFSALTKIVGSTQHVLYRHVNWHTVRWLALGSAPASFLGAVTVNAVADRYAGGENMVKQAIGTLIVLIAPTVIFTRNREIGAGEEFPVHRAFIPLVGVVFGFIVGFTSVGAGTLFTAAMINFFHLSSRRIVGTVTVHACILVWSAAAAQLLFGDISLGVVGWLLIGSIPGVAVGARLSKSISERPLRLAVGIALLASGLALLFG